MKLSPRSGFGRRCFLGLRFALWLDRGQQSGVLFLHDLQLPGKPCGALSGLCCGLGGGVTLALCLGQSFGCSMRLRGGLFALLGWAGFEIALRSDSLFNRLVAAGITSWNEIAAWTEADIAKWDEELKLRGRATREEWVVQAKELLAGKPPRAKADQAELASGEDY